MTNKPTNGLEDMLLLDCSGLTAAQVLRITAWHSSTLKSYISKQQLREALADLPLADEWEGTPDEDLRIETINQHNAELRKKFLDE